MINSLYTAQTGLSTTQTQIDNVSNNIANENTPGYKKRVVNTAELEHITNHTTGRGVSVVDVIRSTSEYLYSNIVTEGSKEAYFDELSTVLGDLEILFEETETAGFTKSLEAYFRALEELKENRENPINVNNYMTQANELVNDLKTLYSNIEAQEDHALEGVKEDASRVNELLHEIAELNRQMGNQAMPTNDLLDRRDFLENELAKYVDIEVDKEPIYEITIAGNRALWNENVREFSIVEDLQAQKNQYVDNDGRTNSLAATVGIMDENDKFVYTIDNVGSIELTFGQTVKDSLGNDLDITGDGIVDANDVVNDSTYIRALSTAINHDPYMNKLVTAYNGDYIINNQGELEEQDYTIDRYLVIESKVPGTDGKFESTLSFERGDAVDGVTQNITFGANESHSTEASNNIYLQSTDEEVINLTGGLITAKLENLSTNSGNNKLQSYKDMLDSLAFTLSDIHTAYAANDDGTYMYGEDSFNNVGIEFQNKIDINLFSGSDVKSLQFNSEAVKDLTQSDLDYLATFRYKGDFSFENSAQNPNSDGAMSFSDYYQDLLVKVSSDKENNDFMLDSQKSIGVSLTSSYDQIVKVDRDEEMLNLVKFQAAYEASAKVITISDQILQTLLGIKQ